MFLSNGQVVPNQITTLADQTPIFSDASYYGQTYLQLANAWAAYGELYRSQLWVGVVVRKLAMSTARINFEIFLGDKRGSQAAEQGPLQDLLDRPNPLMNGFQLRQWTSATRDVYGEAFWLKLRDDKDRVRMIQPMHPRNVIVRREPETGELVYYYSAGVRNVSMLPPIPSADVVAFTNYNPENAVRGVSNLEGLRMTLLNEDASRRANSNFWAKGARPSMVLTHPETLSAPAQERLKKRAEASYGGADNMGGIAVFEEGIKATIMQLNSEEMQYIDSRKLNREEVCASYDVPPPVVHILDRATFSNITEQMRSQYRDTMTPRFVDYEGIIDHQLVPDFYPDHEAFSRFNLEDVLRGDFEKRVASALTMRQAGLGTGNDLLRVIGMPTSTDPVMEKVFANAALVELGTTRETPAPAAAAPVDPFKLVGPDNGDDPSQGADQGKAFLRSVMGKLARVKGNRPAIRQRLIDVHVAELAKYFQSQRDAVTSSLRSKAAGPAAVDTPAWNANLAQILLALSKATTTSMGGATADELDGTYDPGRLEDWLATDAAMSAQNINATTADQIATRYLNAIDDAEDPQAALGGLFDGEVAARGGQISISRVAMLGGLASLVAAEQSGAATKTWVTTAANPRPSHAAMDGETVGLNENFSNGMNGPGDFSGGGDEVAGCTCDLQFSKEES